MAQSALEDLKGQIAGGEYAIDSRRLAGEILSKFALIRRVRRRLLSEAEAEAAGEAGRGAQARGRRGSQPSPRQPRREPLP